MDLSALMLAPSSHSLAIGFLGPKPTAHSTDLLGMVFGHPTVVLVRCWLKLLLWAKALLLEQHQTRLNHQKKTGWIPDSWIPPRVLTGVSGTHVDTCKRSKCLKTSCLGRTKHRLHNIETGFHRKKKKKHLPSGSCTKTKENLPDTLPLGSCISWPKA